MADRAALVFSDDWGRHPSSCQHLFRRLLGKYQVHWVNTIGTRTPRLDLDTLRRGFEKLRHWTRRSNGTSSAPQNLHVVNPKMWPWFSSPVDRWLNRRLLTRQLKSLIRRCDVPPVAVTTLPIVADLMEDLPVKRWIYYCVDDFSEWPGLDGEALRKMEQVVLERADTLIAVSKTLQDKLTSTGRDCHLLTHGVDVDFWANPGPDESMPDLAGLERPLVLFWGVIDRRMDLTFVRRLADELRQGTILLVGPEADPDPALFARRVVRFGSVPFAQLPKLAAEADVLVMPYADLPVTRAMQPLKLKEYLATGRPVVVRELPATRPWAECLDQANTPESFVGAVQKRLAEGLPEHQQLARARLGQESWAIKANDFERWVFQN